MCDVRIGVVSRERPFLCTSLVCAHRYQSLWSQHKCKRCARPLRAPQWASGVCDSPACRQEINMRRIVSTRRKAETARLASATARRNRVAATRGFSVETRDSFRVVVLPRNDAQPVPLDSVRRERLAEHLLAQLADARDRQAAGFKAEYRDDLDEGAPPAASGTEQESAQQLAHSEAQHAAAKALVVTACTACRGNCCTNGGESAYITGRTMLSYLERWPDHDDATIVARYLSLVGAETLQGGCIFQSDIGCTIPRGLRSVTCNTFYCDSINRLHSNDDTPGATRAFFTQLVGKRVVGGEFVDMMSQNADAHSS